MDGGCGCGESMGMTPMMGDGGMMPMMQQFQQMQQMMGQMMSQMGRGGKGSAKAKPGPYDPETEAKLDQWVQAKRARDFVTSDAIQAELEAQGVDTKAARPDPRKAGGNAWGGGGGVSIFNCSGAHYHASRSC